MGSNEVSTNGSTNDTSGKAYAIRAVDRVCDIIDALGASSTGADLAGLTESVGMPKSTVLRYLSVLESRRYVEWDLVAGRYRLGSALRPEKLLFFERLREASLPHLYGLREEFGQTVNLGVLDASEVLHVVVLESTRAVRLALHLGERAPVHSTAMGKLLAARLSELELRELLKHSGMRAVTPNTITDPEVFLDEVRRSEERGYAVDDLENHPQGRCVAVAIDGLTIPLTVSLSAPASQLEVSEVPDIARRLQEKVPPLSEALRAVPTRGLI